MNRRKFLSSAACGAALLPHTVSTSVGATRLKQKSGALTGLITMVKKACERLAPHGWRDLLLSHGLDIMAPNLRNELLKTLPKINRRIRGFEDFALEGRRGIEPGSPARSLLYHAFASPNVHQKPNGASLTSFPTLAEIESVENYVFGATPPLLQEVRSRYPGAPLVIAVFATEYRPALDTAHGRHADMCFSRTGVSRIGTAEALYDGQSRGFLPFVENDSFGIRVLPARYAAYIAVELSGDKTSFGPMRFHEPKDGSKGDETRKFWVPIHKLFDGSECIRGFDLHVFMNAHHVNDKVWRVQENTAILNKWSDPRMYDEYPFTITEGIAEFSSDANHGRGLLTPVPHSKMVEPAVYRGEFRPDLKGQIVTFTVPEGIVNSSGIAGKSSGRLDKPSAPEFVHIRTRLTETGSIEDPPEETDLNSKADMMDILARGKYEAVIYMDYTGDGWISAKCPELIHEVPWHVSAYSIVAPPDFYPRVGQRGLLESLERSVPHSEWRGLWNISPPAALSDSRFAPNLDLAKSGFDLSDTTITAIISLPGGGSAKQTVYTPSENSRRSYMPDEAAAAFDPGADVGLFRYDDTVHLASYKLSSPFPEDTKICAAVSAYWPAAIPDAARSFDQGSESITGISGPWTAVPATDQELGQVGDSPWDGIKGPRLVSHEGKEYAEYVKDQYADYVRNTMDNKFTLALVGRIGLNEYRDRLFCMARVYRVLGTEGFKGFYSLLSFQRVSRNDAQAREAQQKTARKLDDRIFLFRFEVYHPKSRRSHPDPEQFQKSWIEISERTVLYVDPAVILFNEGGGWKVGVE
ncbi:MAG: hypothetical protein ACLGJB_15885 [Blastocatellia bacterium]